MKVHTMASVILLVILLTSQLLSARELDGVSGKAKKESAAARDFFEPDIENVCSLEVACDGGRGTRIPLQLPQGRDGRDGLPGAEGPAGPQGMPGPPGSSGKDVQPSVFMVKLDNHRHASDFESEDEILTFDSVVINIGSDYDLETGRYTVPRSGTYFFSLTVASHRAGEAGMELRSTAGYIGRVWAIGRPTWAMTSSTFTVHLTQNQTAWIKPIQGALEYYGNAYTTFSGHVLFYD